MNRREHLLTCLSEEAAEVSQRVSKALRFGLAEVQAGQPLTNDDRICDELRDVIAVAHILHSEGVIGWFIPERGDVDAKRRKIERYMAIGKTQGVLDDRALPGSPEGEGAVSNGATGPWVTRFGADDYSWNLEEGDASGSPGASMVGNAIAVWLGLQGARQTVATISVVFNLSVALVVQAVEAETWLFLAGDPARPDACYVEADGE